MARKNNENNPLQIRVKAASLPRGVTPRRYVGVLLDFIDGDRDELPMGWDVRLAWRNPRTISGRTKHWQVDSFEDAIGESRSGFVSIVRSALVRALKAVQSSSDGKKRKKKGKKKGR